MTLTASPSKTYTAEAYLALEVESELRSEFRNGEIVEITGGTPAHNEITGMFIFLYSPHVEHYVKQATKQWLFTEYDSLEDSFTLTSVPVEIALSDLYEAIEF